MSLKISSKQEALFHERHKEAAQTVKASPKNMRDYARLELYRYLDVTRKIEAETDLEKLLLDLYFSPLPEGTKDESYVRYWRDLIRGIASECNLPIGKFKD